LSDIAKRLYLVVNVTLCWQRYCLCECGRLLSCTCHNAMLHCYVFEI